MNWTTIEWTDITANPIRGTLGRWHCVKISPGCANCYAARLNHRFLGPDFKVGADTLRLDQDELRRILRKQKIAGKPVAGKRVFLCDMTDIFQEHVKPDWLAQIFDVMGLRRDLTFQILTKRPENFETHLKAYASISDNADHSRYWPRNVHLGVSVETDDYRDRIDELLRLKKKFRIPVAFLSCEPMLGPLHLRKYLRKKNGIDWVICGGESGPASRARMLKPDWARNLRDDCIACSVPFFFKQWGSWRPIDAKDQRDLDGREWNQLPGDLNF